MRFCIFRLLECTSKRHFHCQVARRKIDDFVTSSQSPYTVFSNHAKLLQRERAASDVEQSRLTDYLRKDVAKQIVERLLV